jgi:hypothetical protein
VKEHRNNNYVDRPVFPDWITLQTLGSLWYRHARCQDSSVGIARGRFPVGTRTFSILHSVQTRRQTHLMGTGVSFPGGKAARA